jgi:tetratricopeptide (TPR) repeat protein
VKDMREVFKPIVFLMLFLSTFSLFSQNSRIVDSLRTLIAKAPDDSNKVNLYYTLSRQFDIFKSKDYFEINLAALNLSQKINFTSGINRHYSNVIRFLFQRGIYDLAIAYYHDYEQFLTENNMNDELQASYNMYGNLLSRQKKYSEAALFYHKAKDFQFSKNDDQKYANVLNNLSILYLNTGNYDSSLTYCSSALLIYKKNNSSSAIANSILGLAELYLKKGDFQMAESRVFESIDIYEILNEKQGLCNCYYVLGLIYNQTDNYPKSLLYTNKSLDLAKDLNLLEVQRANDITQDCYLNLSVIFEKTQRFKLGLDYYKKFIEFRDSTFSVDAKNKSIELEYAHEYDIIQKVKDSLETSKQVAVYSLEIEKQNAELKVKRNQQMFLFGGLFMVLCLLFLCIIDLRLLASKKILLNNKKFKQKNKKN